MTDRVVQRVLAKLSGRSGQTANMAAPSASQEQLKRQHLLETEVFASMSAAEEEWLMTNTAMITCEAGRVFHTPDDASEVMFVLKRGRVNLYRMSPEGRKLVVSSLGPHSIFGQMGMIGQSMPGCFAEAADECLICVLSVTDLQTLIHRNPQVGIDLLTEMARRLQEREADLERLAFAGVPARLANLLLQEATDENLVSGFSHQDLADRIGTYRETVSQTLGRWKADGIVEVEPRNITIRNYPALERLINNERTSG